MNKTFSNRRASVIKWLLALIAAVAVIWYVISALDNVDSAQGEEGRRVLEDSLRRAAVSSYTSLGRYPATLDELTGRYGIVINEDCYAVFYEVFADNIMPDITVVSLGSEGGQS